MKLFTCESSFGPNEITLSKIPTSITSYMGSNAYGLKGRVQLIRSKIEGVAFKSEELRQEAFRYDQFGTDLNLDGEQARKVAASPAVLLIGKLEPPYIINCSQSHAPTMSNLIELDISRRLLNMKIEEVWFFNYETGEVFTK